MISQRGRDTRKGKALKMTKNVERLYREGKCRDCSVMVTRMDFAKILGKFTKVKIQYESSSTPKTKNVNNAVTNLTPKLNKSENGLVPRRTVNKQLQAKEPLSVKKPKNVKQTPVVTSPRPGSNILKENNRLKKTPILKDKNSNYNQKLINSNLKRYGIIFINPNVNNNSDVKSKATLLELLPDINKSILPSEEWAIDYFPKSEEPKEDKVYDRIAAELEDLMYNNEKTSNIEGKSDVDNKVDDFPSIMDILNESTPEIISKPNDQSNLESSDVEAMLLGKSDEALKEPETVPMDVDNTDMTNLIGEVPMETIQGPVKNQVIASMQKQSEKSCVDNLSEKSCVDNLSIPFALDDSLQKGIPEQLPFDDQSKDCLNEETPNKPENQEKSNTADDKSKCESDSIVPKTEVITHVIFKQTINGKCHRCVTCPKNLKYSIELNGKAVEFIGAPKFISSLEDLEVLLQIVNESHLESLYVLH